MNWRVFSDSPELGVELANGCAERGIQVDLSCEGPPWDSALTCVLERRTQGPNSTAGSSSTAVMVISQDAPEGVVLAHTPVDVWCCPRMTDQQRGWAWDLGIAATPDLGTAGAIVALMDAGATAPWKASLRPLGAMDRARLTRVTPYGKRPSLGAGQLFSEIRGVLGWSNAEGEQFTLGRIEDVAQAVDVLRQCRQDATPSWDTFLGDPGAGPTGSVGGFRADPERARETLFGPQRILSDPSSKQVLQHYGLQLPTEVLCSSPSRAAVEAARLGFPVRMTLASPDLRVWDHPELRQAGVDNGARVRDVFRQMSAWAQRVDPQSRVLGLWVSVGAPSMAELWVRMEPLHSPETSDTEGPPRVRVEFGFADAHGRAAGDAQTTLLPCSPGSFEKVLSRLQGCGLLRKAFGPAGEPRDPSWVAPLHQWFHRLALFVHEQRDAVGAVEVNPLSILADGSIELQEASIAVTDCFENALTAWG